MLRPLDDIQDDLTFVYAHSGAKDKDDNDNRIYQIAAIIIGENARQNSYSSLVRYTKTTAKEYHYSNVSKDKLVKAPPKEQVAEEVTFFLRNQKYIFMFDNNDISKDLQFYTGAKRIVDLHFAAEYFLPFLESHSFKNLWEFFNGKPRNKISFDAGEVVNICLDLIRYICGKILNDTENPNATVIRYCLLKSNSLFGQIFAHITKNYQSYFGHIEGGLLNPYTKDDTNDWRQFLPKSQDLHVKKKEKVPYKKIIPASIDQAYAEFRANDRNFNDRPTQIEYSREIAHALNEGQILIIEAGTGTGKTQGYLIPVMEHLYLNPDSRVAISTYTKNLQNQIYNREIKHLTDTHKKFQDISYALLKGKSNYICVEKLDDLYDEEKGPNYILAWLYLLNLVFHFRDAEGDVVGSKVKKVLEKNLDFGQFLNEISAKNGCSVSHKTCPAQVVMGEALASRLIVTNHSKLALLQAEALLSGLFSNYIIDEASHFEHAVRDAFGIDLVSKDLFEIVNYIKNVANSINAKGSASFQPAMKQVLAFIDALKNEVNTISLILKSMNNHTNSNVTEMHHLRPNDHKFKNGHLENHLNPIKENITDIVKQFDVLDNLDNPKEAGLSRRKVNRLGTYLDQLKECLENVKEIIEKIIDDNNVLSYRIFEKNWILSLQPVDVSEIINNKIHKEKDSIVYTSATLSQKESFDIFGGIIGVMKPGASIKVVKSCCIPSPFAPGAMEIICHKDAVSGEYNNKEVWCKKVIDILPDLITKNNGSTLVLFSSYEDLKKVAKEVSEQIIEAGFPLFIQEPGISTIGISEEFRTIKESVLFGVDTFWYGVDFKGDTLTQLIITRLPFPNPNDPIQLSRKRTMNRDIYWQRYSYEKDIKLRQGIGRLIRSETDWGKVYILDSRYIKP